MRKRGGRGKSVSKKKEEEEGERREREIKIPKSRLKPHDRKLLNTPAARHWPPYPAGPPLEAHQPNEDTQTSATDKVRDILLKAREEVKSVQVEVKEIQLECDLGNLVVSDNNTLPQSTLRNSDECNEYLQSLARDGIQTLITKVWDLPTERIDNAVYVTLPKPSISIPREKKAPVEKPLTKWEQYAKDKGITKRKKEKKVWDEVLKQWVPRYGFRKVQADKEKNWVRVVPETADPYEDQYAKAAEIKKENIAKNEFQRLRNIARNRKVKLPSVGVTGNEFARPKDLLRAAQHAKHATASLGKFQPGLKGEKSSKGRGNKRKSEEVATMDIQQEKKRNIDIFDKIGKPDLNLDAAMYRQVKDDNVEHDRKKKGGKKHLRRSKMGGRHLTPSDHRSIKLGKGIHNGPKGKSGKGRDAGPGNKGKGKDRASLLQLASKRGATGKIIMTAKKRKKFSKR
ncbi:hypothetical protein Pcinc_013937 [Petrolisthes cinctipes]|uniref:Ribosome biogenesis regulatory protein n=1 Tax=Petrolisthes cinctipes TaxID=88211 RepID=A0AAE1FXI4_PETCI|nr:hypothetical protein Pcinc_013937 [Petrolisthes cinctipes]